MVSNSSHTSSLERVDISSHANYRYLLTPEKHERLRRLHKENQAMGMQVTRLRAKVNKAITEKGIASDSGMMKDLQQVVLEEE